MGESDSTMMPFSFNRSIKVEGRPERLSADAGALLAREVDERLGWTALLAKRLHDPREQDLITHPLIELLNTSIVLLGQGWRDQDDADTGEDAPGSFAMATSLSGMEGGARCARGRNRPRMM